MTQVLSEDAAHAVPFVEAREATAIVQSRRDVAVSTDRLRLAITILRDLGRTDGPRRLGGCHLRLEEVISELNGMSA